MSVNSDGEISTPENDPQRVTTPNESTAGDQIVPHPHEVSLEDEYLISGDEVPFLTEIVTLETPAESAAIDSPLHDAVVSLKEHISLEVGKIDAVLNDKLAYDRFKEEQITRLHDELKAYKSDLVFETMRPLVNGLIRIHDDMAKVTESVVAEGAEAAMKSVSLITGFQEDIEILLAEVDVISYREETTVFDPRRQQSIRTMPTNEQAKVGQVAQHLRPGFERCERIVRKEKVSVFVLDPNCASESIKTESQENI